MATINKITDLIAAIKTIYPYYAKETDVETLVNTWNLLLKDYNDKAVDFALLKCLQTCKMPPTPADIIEQLNEMEQANGVSVEELWARFVKALRQTEKQMYYFNHTFIEESGLTQGQIAKNKVEEIWAQLPEELKNYVGSKGELMRIARDYSDEDLKFERNRFFKTIPTIKKRQNLLLESQRLMLE